jgi:hypothetical protein
MEVKWNVYVLRPVSLMAFSYTTQQQAFLAAYEIVNAWKDSALVARASRQVGDD